MFIDADAHVDECEETWSYLPKSHEDLRPRTLSFPNNDAPSWLYAGGGIAETGGSFDFWFIDGQIFPRRIRSDELTGTTRDKRELRDVPGRIGDMDHRQIDIQVLYSTLFLNEVSRRTEVLSSLYHSYNRWLADRCADSHGRLKFIAMIPFSSPEEGVREMEFVKEHGACGFFKRPVDVGRSIGDPFFFPFYDAAVSLDLPMCTHACREWTPVTLLTSSIRLAEHDHSILSVLVACASLLDQKVPRRIANLRWGFIESASAWMPYLLARANWDGKAKVFGPGVGLADLNFYVTCETYERIPHLIEAVGGDDNIVVGTDYSHADNSSILDAHQRILSRDDLDPVSARKITCENARTLYGLGGRSPASRRG